MYPKVKYELQELEKLVFSGSHRSVDANDGSVLKQLVKFETERVMQVLALDALTFHNEDQLERYIRYHQHSIIRLMDGVTELLSVEDSNQKKFYLVCYNCLEELLYFVENYFAKYFDHDVKAPEGYIAKAKKDAHTNCKKLLEAFADKNVDPNLLNVILRVPKKIITKNSNSRITYHMVVYAKEVQKELFRFLEQESETWDLNEELRHVMYYLNYNSVKVLTYHAHYITSLLDAAETRVEKIEKLSFALKRINQAHVKPGLQYHKHGLSLKDQLNNYINEELGYQERLQQLSKNSSQDIQETTITEFKIKFTASVSQLAYLLKILIETKIILNNNLSQVLQFLVKHVVTKKSETISHGSIRSKYYVVENGTKESVRAMLTSLIQYIDKT